MRPRRAGSSNGSGRSSGSRPPSPIPKAVSPLDGVKRSSGLPGGTEPPMRETWVVGAATNRFGKIRETGREAAAKVALAALEAAGLQPREVQHTFVANAFGVAERQAHVGPLLNTALGIPEVPSVTLESACSSSSAALHEAYVHVAGGFEDVALVVGFEKLSHLDTMASTSYFAMGADYAFETRN